MSQNKDTAHVMEEKWYKLRGRAGMYAGQFQNQ